MNYIIRGGKMNVEFKRNGHTLIVNLSGELDHHSAEKIREEIDLTMDKGFKNLIFNFSKVSFMDSSGIGVIIGRYKKVQRKGGITCITCLSDKIKRIFDISGLFKIIPYYSSDEDALEKIV